jgi:excisionase family DNA binding protein
VTKRNLEDVPKTAWGLNEIAESTGLSLGFLRNEVRRGALRVSRFGRRVLILDEDFTEYLTRKRENSDRSIDNSLGCSGDTSPSPDRNRQCSAN